MQNLASASVIKKILAENSFRFSKSLGQNFLIDESALEKIIAGSEIDSSSNVLEIGPGFGTLTQKLCENAKKVVSVEIDSSVIPILNENLAEFKNVNIINADIMKTDIASLIKKEFGDNTVKVCANLPYYITTPVIDALLKPGLPITDITVMVQKEVAERMAASPGSKSYGALSVSVGYYAQSEIIAHVPPSSFIPQPKVYSSVIRLKMRNTPPVSVTSPEIYFKVVRAAFTQRRKTLLNSLVNSGIFKISKDEAQKLLSAAGIDPKRRGETLSLSEFAAIANIICNAYSAAEKLL